MKNSDKDLKSLQQLTLKTLSKEGVRFQANGENRIAEALNKILQISNLGESKVGLTILRKLVKSIAGSRGLSIKAAQLASFLEIGLSSELAIFLGDLQSLAKPLPLRRVYEILDEAYGSVSEAFSYFDETPLAITSLGQVHRARLHSGEDVVIKIKHPEIHRLLSRQINTLSFLVSLKSMYGASFNSAFEEIQKQILLELDYEREAKNQEFYRQHFSYEPRIVIPKVFPDFCRTNILVSQYQEGQSFEQFIQQASKARKSEAALLIAFFHSTSIMRLRRIHADAHPGNFLFRDNKVIFVDFGRIIDRTPDETESDRQFYMALINKNKDEVIRLAKERNLVTNPSTFDFDEFWEVLQVQQKHHMVDGRFKIDRNFMAAVRERTKKFQNITGLRIDRGHLITMLVNVSLWSLFAQMEAEANWQRQALHVMNLSETEHFEFY